jgi:hypothetical protein
LSAARISAIANASHVVPNGVVVLNAKSLATICRAICSLDIAANQGAGAALIQHAKTLLIFSTLALVEGNHPQNASSDQ